MVAEFMGKEAGYCRGRGGSMHIADVEGGNLGANGVVGGGIPIAVGVGLSLKMQKRDQIILCFFGDISDRAAAYGMPGTTVDGNDLVAVYEAVSQAVKRARAGAGPSLIENVTYRWRGHSKSDANRYRTREEIEAWKQKCPIKRFRARLTEEEVLTEEDADQIEQEAYAAIDAAVAFAEASPEPALDYAEAIREALRQEMQRDERVFIIGEDVGVYGGAFGGVIDTPISELGIAGAITGAALTGMRPVGEIMFMDFTTLAAEQLVNQAAKIRFMFGGKAKVPLVLRTPAGSGTGAAAQHSQSLENWFVHVPGLKVVMPSTPYDAKGLLLASIRDDVAYPSRFGYRRGCSALTKPGELVRARPRSEGGDAQHPLRRQRAAPRLDP
jgi:hypothetical protein